MSSITWDDIIFERPGSREFMRELRALGAASVPALLRNAVPLAWRVGAEDGLEAIVSKASASAIGEHLGSGVDPQTRAVAALYFGRGFYDELWRRLAEGHETCFVWWGNFGRIVKPD
jgi:hypothetical protein